MCTPSTRDLSSTSPGSPRAARACRGARVWPRRWPPCSCPWRCSRGASGPAGLSSSTPGSCCSPCRSSPCASTSTWHRSGSCSSSRARCSWSWRWSSSGPCAARQAGRSRDSSPTRSSRTSAGSRSSRSCRWWPPSPRRRARRGLTPASRARAAGSAAAARRKNSEEPEGGRDEVRHPHRSHGGPLDEMRKLWKFADAQGFDWFSVSDHFQESPPRGGDMDCYEAIATLTAAAMDTRKIRLGSGVYCVAYRNPGLLAKSLTTIDHLSQGRVDCGLGAGWHDGEAKAFGYPFPSIGPREDVLEEYAQIMRLLLDPEQRRVDFAGKHFQIANAPNNPKPL